jgi:hypothetical protein
MRPVFALWLVLASTAVADPSTVVEKAEAALREVNARYRRRVDALYARDGHLHGQSEELWRDADSDT